MKKFLSLCLALVLCVGLAVPAFAAEYESFSFTINGYDYQYTISGEAAITRDHTFFIMEEALAGSDYTGTLVELEPGSTLTVTVTVTGDRQYVAKQFSKESDDWYTEHYGGDYYYAELIDWEPIGLTTGPVDDQFDDYVALHYARDYVTDDKYFFVLGGEGSSTGSGTSSQPETPEPAPTTPDVYTVKAGDTMGKLALNYYGSYGYHVELTRLNAETLRKTNYILYVGMELVLPEKLGEVSRLSPQVTGEGETLYTVKAGDTLSGIAKAVYGDMMKYQAIYERNADRLKDANTIYEGQVIILPAK